MKRKCRCECAECVMATSSYGRLWAVGGADGCLGTTTGAAHSSSYCSTLSGPPESTRPLAGGPGTTETTGAATPLVALAVASTAMAAGSPAGWPPAAAAAAVGALGVGAGVRACTGALRSAGYRRLCGANSGNRQTGELRRFTARIVLRSLSLSRWGCWRWRATPLQPPDA